MKTNVFLKTGIFHRKRICGVALYLLTTAAVGQTALQSNLDRLLDDGFYQTATVGISVYDLTEGRTLYNRNERHLCRPASNMKLLTSAAALHFLGSSHEFRTCLLRTGTVDDAGCLHGNLYLIGGFDPEFSSSGLDTMILMLQKAGISRFEGKVHTDVSMFDGVQWGKGWSWDDDMEAFQPYLSPLPLNKGVVKLKTLPAAPGHAPVILTEPGSDFIRIENNAATVWQSPDPARKTLHFSRTFDGSHNTIAVSGTIAAKAQAYETAISLQSPEMYIETVFREKLSEQLPGSRPESGGRLVPPAAADTVGYVRHGIWEVIRQMNKESDNLNAEMLLYALGRQCCGDPASTEKGVEQLRQMLRQLGLNPEHYSIVDGSGLSHQNYLTPEVMIAILKHLYATQEYEPFKLSLPEAGMDGTLKNRMKKTPAYRKVFAKTGSLTGISALSGYMEAPNGHLLAFSVMVQNFVEKNAFVNANHIDKICDRILTDALAEP
ncbi:MAG: D-alanyl-D-alanine carboxypeptidase/D-alanyl-D-alanine-endopeptidase [Bacteroidales bacterium]|jgi:D-alanyl-D-alanine carboxypeptidase/D-alanyl-D-alanine-endopeptidase (penicillin-binding protein 4)|nr:D-alanyl-D-alanine carboxypeptidase/D-alanyl-D-alanine-endopeptidase [Bacteroidales bacterium]